VVEVADRVADVFIDEVGVQRDSGRGAGARGGDDLARGSTMLPAAQTPATLVRPVLSTLAQPSASTSQPQAHEQWAVRDEAGRHEQRVAGHDRAIVHLDAAQVVGVVSVAGKLPMFPLSVTDSLHPCGAVELSAAG